MAKKKNEPILEISSEVDFEYEDPEVSEYFGRSILYICKFKFDRYSNGVTHLKIGLVEKEHYMEGDMDIYLTEENLKQLMQTIRPLLKNDT